MRRPPAHVVVPSYQQSLYADWCATTGQSTAGQNSGLTPTFTARKEAVRPDTWNSSGFTPRCLCVSIPLTQLQVHLRGQRCLPRYSPSDHVPLEQPSSIMLHDKITTLSTSGRNLSTVRPHRSLLRWKGYVERCPLLLRWRWLWMVLPRTSRMKLDGSGYRGCQRTGNGRGSSVEVRRGNTPTLRESLHR